jgi:hypothetical protein
MPHTRRQFLGATATAATVGLSTVLTGSTSAQVDTSEWAYKPDHITYSYDQTELEAYQPLFETSREARRQLIGIYGFKAESTEYDRDAYYYWLRYNFQDSATDTLGSLSQLLSGGPDSHFLDHEPIIIFTNANGTPDRVVTTGYHHFALEIDADTDDTVWTQNRLTGIDSHAHLNVVDPWHHYKTVPPPAEDSTATFLQSVTDVENWLAVREAWKDNGLYAKSHGPAIEDPFVMLERDTWWADGTIDKQFAPLWIRFGLGGARDSDQLRVEDS